MPSNVDPARQLDRDRASVSAHNLGGVANRCHRRGSHSTTDPITMVESRRTSPTGVTPICDDKTSRRDSTQNSLDSPSGLTRASDRIGQLGAGRERGGQDVGSP